MHQAQPKQDSPAAKRDEDLEEILAEVEYWRIDDFVDILPLEPRIHLSMDAA